MAIFFSPLVLAQFSEHHVPQMVQTLSELNRVDQGAAAAVVAVQPVQILAGDQKRSNAPAVGPDPYVCQAAAAGKQVCAFEKVCGLQADQKITSYPNFL
jgi:hypothetical protein